MSQMMAVRKNGEHGRGRFGILVILPILLLCGVLSGLWMMRDPGMREDLTKHAENVGGSLVQTLSGMSSPSPVLPNSIQNASASISSSIQPEKSISGNSQGVVSARNLGNSAQPNPAEHAMPADTVFREKLSDADSADSQTAVAAKSKTPGAEAVRSALASLGLNSEGTPEQNADIAAAVQRATVSAGSANGRQSARSSDAAKIGSAAGKSNLSAIAENNFTQSASERSRETLPAALQTQQFAQGRQPDKQSDKPLQPAKNFASIENSVRNDNSSAALQNGILAENSHAQNAGKAIMRVPFLEDLAQWLVSGYVPAGKKSHAHIKTTLQSANLRYGKGMRGLSWIGQTLPAERAAALQYVFTPAMLDTLYTMYIDSFMDAVGRKSATLGNTRRGEMYSLYAKRFRGISGALLAVADMHDFHERMTAMKADARKVVSANTEYSNRTLALDHAREKGDKAHIQILAAKADSAAKVYRQSVQNREKRRTDLIQSMRKNPDARELDDDTLLYAASWVGRRLEHDPAKTDAVRQGSELFRNLARHFDAAGVASK